VPVLPGQLHECRMIHAAKRFRQGGFSQSPANQVVTQQMAPATASAQFIPQLFEGCSAGYAVNAIGQQENVISITQTGQTVVQGR
jgi:hypothetical protein